MLVYEVIGSEAIGDDLLGGDFLSLIISTLFIWLFLSICFFLYKYYRHIRAERARFHTLEPEFHDLDSQYNHDRSNSSSIVDRFSQWFERLSPSITLNIKLDENRANYKSCTKCGSFYLKYEPKCEICGSEEFKNLIENK